MNIGLFVHLRSAKLGQFSNVILTDDLVASSDVQQSTDRPEYVDRRRYPEDQYSIHRADDKDDQSSDHIAAVRATPSPYNAK